MLSNLLIIGLKKFRRQPNLDEGVGFLARHRREILYTQTVGSWKKNTLQDLKKVYSYGVIQLILYK